MKRLRFTTVIALTITTMSVIVMCWLGFWQLDRMAQKQQRLDSITQKQGNESLSLIRALATDEPRDRPVAFEGSPDASRVLLLDNQIYQQQIGYDVLVPVNTNAGWLLVNYGWLPAPDMKRTLPNVTIENKDVQQFTGVLTQPSNNPLITETLSEVASYPARIQQVSIDGIGRLLDLELLPYIVVLTNKSSTFSRHYEPVVMPPEKHLGYAIQWFGLAVAAAVIGGFAMIKKGRSDE